ncbi:MAG: DUF4364 family protein [Oscillospiraceae bacterium]|nr:DUF4364 family protein [Oscillospiraceae bacterium]
MDQLGLVYEKLDIKMLILYVLRRLPLPVDPETLLEICQYDGRIGYFDWSECLSELLESGHIAETEEGYQITDKGARNADETESSLSYSIRAKVTKRIEPVAERMRRLASITARHMVGEDGCMVELAVSDGKGEMIHLHLLCAGEEQARTMEKRFRKDAEGIYQKIVELLSE